jgi:archaellum component FlaG (FlaF/FlaG flagellin family)
MLTIAAIVAIVAVANAVLPSVSRTSGALISASNTVEDRIASQIEIVHATGQDGDPDADIWVKNTGAATIAGLERVDVFFGPDGDFQRIPQGTAGCTAPCWEYEVENSTTWEPTATLHITVHASTDLAAGTTYYVKIVTPLGIVDAKYFTV